MSERNPARSDASHTIEPVGNKRNTPDVAPVDVSPHRITKTSDQSKVPFLDEVPDPDEDEADEDEDDGELCDICGDPATHYGFPAVGIVEIKDADGKTSKYWPCLIGDRTPICENCIEEFIN